MKEENSFISLDQVTFIIRHPWLFICPIIMILSVSFAYLPYVEKIYQTTATVSFQMAGENVPSSGIDLNREVGSIVDRVLLGDSLRSIIGETWPQIKEEANPLEYQILASRLKNQKSGIQIIFDKNTPSLLTISYIDRSPEICFKLLKAVIDAMQKETEQRGKEGLKTGISFLKKQVQVYRERVNLIEGEMTAIKNELKKIYPSLNEREKFLANEAMQDKSLNFLYAADLQKIAKYEESIANLSMQLIEAERSREMLAKQIENDSMLLSAQDLESDPLIQDYTKSILNKERELAELGLKGYLPEHPTIKTVKSELEALKILKEDRINELTTQVSSIPEEIKKEVRAKTNYELKRVEFGIATIKEKINLMEKIKKDAEKQYKPTQEESLAIADKLQRLSVLSKELEINSTYYSDVRKRLEQAELMVRLETEKSGFVMKVIEEPRIPLAPMPKKSTKMFMLFIVAVGAGTILAFLADSLDTSIKTRSELKELLQTPILAAISRFYTIEEMSVKRQERRVIVISLVVFVILSQLFIRMLF